MFVYMAKKGKGEGKGGNYRTSRKKGGEEGETT